MNGLFAPRQQEAASKQKTMARGPHRNRSPAFNAKVAVAASKDEETPITLAKDFDVHPNQIKQWRDQLRNGAMGALAADLAAEPELVIDVKAPDAKIGDLKLGERTFMLRTRQSEYVAERKEMIDPILSITTKAA